MSNISSKDVHVPLHLRIDATRQILQLIRGEHVEKTYPISTSKFGLGAGTPLVIARIPAELQMPSSSAQLR